MKNIVGQSFSCLSAKYKWAQKPKRGKPKNKKKVCKGVCRVLTPI